MIRGKVSDTEAALDLLEEIRIGNYTGGSGRGMSFWQDAAKCGMRAKLSEARRKGYLADPSSIPPVSDEALATKNAFIVGTAYHKFHELWRKLPDTALDDVYHSVSLQSLPTHDASIKEAVRLFNGWMAHWPKDAWGQTIAVEEQIPGDAVTAMKIGALLGTEVSARPDLVTLINQEKLPAITQRCPEITEPGYYIVDFKTSDQPYTESYYKSGLQALWYPIAWNLQHPDQPVHGVIFDQIFKFSRRRDQAIRDENFAALFVPAPNAEDVATLRGLIEQGIDNIWRAEAYGIGNRAECFQFSFGGVKSCPFFGNECKSDENSFAASWRLG